MAEPQTLGGYEYKLEYGGTAATPSYVKICAIEATEITLERSAIERAIRDCATDFAAPTMKRKPGMKTASISGSGLYATEHVNTLMTAHADNDPAWWRITSSDGAVWAGKFVMPSLAISFNADGQAFAEITISLQSSGAITFTPVV